MGRYGADLTFLRPFFVFRHDRPVWRTATFFADLPWHWLAYHGATLSRVLGPGHAHPLKVSYSAADSTRFDAALDEAYTFWNRSLALVNATGEDCNQVRHFPAQFPPFPPF